MIKEYFWNLIDELHGNRIEKYCHNCGKKVAFKDSNKLRNNANGKNIYQYAIYKCDKGHSWNKFIRTYKAGKDPNYENSVSNISEKSTFERISTVELKRKGIKEIKITLNKVIGRWRIDKFLNNVLHDLSRTKINKMIKIECILVDNECIEKDYLLKDNQVIQIINIEFI